MATHWTPSGTVQAWGDPVNENEVVSIGSWAPAGAPTAAGSAIAATARAPIAQRRAVEVEVGAVDREGVRMNWCSGSTPEPCVRTLGRYPERTTIRCTVRRDARPRAGSGMMEP